MRLTRHGRKRYAFYHIVVADSRAPRDGRYIERIGMYNPNSNPATIDLDFDKAYDWLVKGAQPTDTVRAILSYKGVLYKKHLMGGVKKGAFDEEEAERRLEKWLTEKEAKIQAQKERIEGETNAELKKRLEAEAKLNEERAAAIAAKNAELAGEVEDEEEAATTEESTEESTEAAATEEATETAEKAKATEEPEKEEKAAEPVKEEKAEEAAPAKEESAEKPAAEEKEEAKEKEEEKPEAPAAEAKSEEAEKEEKKEEAPKDKGADS
ncbi:30S ribosomal protein S16 [Tangfeifania diversioriginum]|nr:30S ribosomal protein S16 [Tangfeifania diversioriginum]